MTSYWLNVAALRVVIPATLAACAIWRPSGLSIVYLALMLYSPMVPIPADPTINSHAGGFLGACAILTSLTSIAQLVFHIVLLSLPPYGHFLRACEFLEMILRHVGFVRMDGASVWQVFYWLLPEIVAFPVTLAMYVCWKCAGRSGAGKEEDGESTSARPTRSRREDDASTKMTNFLGTVGTYVVLGSLCCVSCLTPSVEGAIYFLVFIGAATWWSCHRELHRGFAVVCRILMVLVVFHILAVLAYQNQWPQQFLPVNSTWSRYFALYPYYTSNCTDPRNVDYVVDEAAAEWTSYAHALGLFWLYYVLALQSRFLFGRKPKPAEPTSCQPNETTPLMRFGSGRTGLLQDSTGSVIVQDTHQDDGIQLRSLSEGTTEDGPGIVEQVIMAVYSIFQLIVNSSYLATNIIMMTWSIMYHSWTTFILLMWALVLWMVPDKRSSMMKCSPFIVFYSTLLVLVGYVYSMNLTEDELPTVFHGIKMAEIGFSKTDQSSSWHQIVKCGFMSMFWITLRQYMAERKSRKRTMTMRDMVAPLHLSVSTATTAMNKETPEIKSKFMKNVGRIVKRLLVKFWIAIVAIMLFTSGITGERMTVFRIIYMSLFLVFVITFQISWRAWRKMMYGFWITVIAYSVVMLILVYTYQFHNFPSYWEYLHIDRDLQMDIGLETYETKDLFVRLLTPTFFVIVTVLQIHYFHDEFLRVTRLDRVEIDTVANRPSLGYASTVPMVYTAEIITDTDNQGEEPTPIYTLKQLKQMSKMERTALIRRTIHHLRNFYNWLWLLLEMHMQKIIFISLMLLCIKDVCAINLFFVIAVVATINFRKSYQITMVNVMAGTIALLMVIKMLYQIKYIDHENWSVNCTRPEANGTEHETSYNIAQWVGMRKAEPGRLPDLLKGYIGMVTVTTIRAIITIRQCFHRHGRGEPLETPLVMFPEITRADADKGIPECLKFLLNYGFYKFGLEFCLMAIVAVVGTRLDFFSLLYGLWLLVLFALKRTHTARVWPFFRMFTMIVLPVQYALVVAPPTWLCIDYPWSSSATLRRLQEWMYFPDPDFRPNPEKLMCDFVLLLMIARQSLVFRIETRNRATGQQFAAAGHNFAVFQDMDKPNFVNPVKDYVSHVHCWLDVVKRGSMMSFMWITLSIMFLAGTKRTDIFSLGYLIGAFIFLWQGSDFYLRPIPTILKWWNILIGYNVVVIVGKAFFQGVGCVMLKELQGTACWMIQLLGIGCPRMSSQAPSLIDFERKEAVACEILSEDIGMLWDGLCFACLLIQKRLFKSHYFFHIVDETKAMSILASRGAELLQDLHRKRIEHQESVERAVLQKLKFKMDKIKADQRRIQGPSYREPATHKVEARGEAPLARTSSVSSCVSSGGGRTPPQGYRTPIDDNDDASDAEDDPAPLSPRLASRHRHRHRHANHHHHHHHHYQHLQAPSPNSAIMTVSLEGYLEPTRISFGSPPSSELNPRGPSPDETFPVFSPPPYERARRGYGASLSSRGNAGRSSYICCGPWNSGLETPRASVISTTASRSPLSHHTYSLYPADRPLYRHRPPNTNREAVRSGDYYMFDDLDDDDVTDLSTDPEAQREDKERLRQHQEKGRRMTVAELMTTLLKTDIEIATHVAMYGGTQKDALRLRRQSVPLTRKKSSMSYLSARSETETAAAIDGETEGGSLGSAEVDEIERELKNEDLTKTPMDSDREDRAPDGTENADETIAEEAAPLVQDGEPESSKKSVSFLTYFKFILVFVNSAMVSMTRYLNRFSRDYRYIRKVLSKEKKILKATPDFRTGTRLGINQIWQPIPMIKHRNKESSLTVPHIRILAPSLERGLDMSSSSSNLGGETRRTEDEEFEQQQQQEQQPFDELSEVDQPPIIQLASSIWFGILAHSTFMCYFMVFLHQIKNASVISIPLPLMVFFWGSLTIPRPSKTFWVTLIAYTEVVVIVKCIFQFDIISWSQTVSRKHPLFAPRILGVEKNPNYALWDLLLLLVVFFHRFMLKSLGQWTAPVAPRKILPSTLTLVKDGSRKNPPEDQDEKEPPARFHWQNEETEKRTTDNGTVVAERKNAREDYDDDDDDEEREDNVAEDGGAKKELAVTGSSEQLVAVRAEESRPDEAEMKMALGMTLQRYIEPAKIFFRNILSPEGKEKTNVYAYMFLCDFFNFILLIFGFSAFGTQQGDGGVAAYLSENRVPMPFLLMLLLQFALIVIDRALFLRKSILGKLVFHYLLVFGVHVCMFFILPSVTERQFNEKLPPQIWYMVKCFYLLLAAYQLRLGYPTRILGNFLCKNYSIVNMYLFKGFMFVPFLFELRSVMDWIWTDTSMTIMDWFKMEDIFASIYQIKCTRGVETDFPQPRGVKKTQMSKYMVGGGALFLMIGLIWFPLLLFALGGTVGVSNPPSEVSMRIRIGPYEPIYGMAAQASSIEEYTEENWNSFKDLYARDKTAMTFLENYGNSDVTAVRLSGSSRKLWGISPPDRERLRMELESNNTVTVYVEWTVTRKTDVKDFNGVTVKTNKIQLAAWENGEFNPVRKSLADMLSTNSDANSANGTIVLKNAFPKFLKVTSRSVDAVQQLSGLPPQENGQTDDISFYRNVSLQLSTNLDCCAHQQWWIVKENCNDTTGVSLLSKVPLNDCKYIMMFLFNDKAFPEGLSFISGFGILGLYTTAVIVMSQIIRRGVSEMAPKIMFDDLPYVDRILRLCLDVYLVRESGELCLEEDLFAKLIFLYRSPETLIRWTRPPEPGVDGTRRGDDDDDDDEDDDDDVVNVPRDESNI